ncbi:MAG: helix-turn-helix transcriptional regulator [Myxococcota bacterium]
MRLAIYGTPMTIRQMREGGLHYALPAGFGFGWIRRIQLSRGAFSAIRMRYGREYHSCPRVALQPVSTTVVVAVQGTSHLRTDTGWTVLKPGFGYVFDTPVRERRAPPGQAKHLVYHLHEALLPAGQRVLAPHALTLAQRLLDPDEADDLDREADALRLLARLRNGDGEPHWSARARALLLRDLTNPPALVDLAAQMGLSPRSLTRGFHTHFGTSVFGLLRQERLRRARELLNTTDLPIGDIAYQLGFSSSSHLARVFREAMGVTPGAYRQSNPA